MPPALRRARGYVLSLYRALTGGAFLSLLLVTGANYWPSSNGAVAPVGKMA